MSPSTLILEIRIFDHWRSKKKKETCIKQTWACVTVQSLLPGISVKQAGIKQECSEDALCCPLKTGFDAYLTLLCPFYVSLPKGSGEVFWNNVKYIFYD